MKFTGHHLVKLFIAFGLLAIPNFVHAHGGIPGVIDLLPPKNSSSDTFWMIDTLGLFRGDASSSVMQPLNQRSWSWLCDDAVDPMLGVDALLVIDSETLVAVARSGLYRSTDMGCTFIRLESPINEHTIGGISAHHTRSNEIAIFTNSIGRDNRVWWSADKGKTWTPSDLLIEGGIFGIWRDPRQPDNIWVNHAEGLSVSHDSGQHFISLSEVNYSGASPYEVRLLSGGYINDRLILWASLDHYPTSSLLMTEDLGQNWREIHNLNDAYDEVALTEGALWVSTIFSGLFVYPVTELESLGEEMAWNGLWQHYPETKVSCLTPDPLDFTALWACGRSEQGWLVGRSTDLGQSWSVLMERYQEASEGMWECPSDSMSNNACSTRCLDEDCDPSQNQTITEETETTEESLVEMVDMNIQQANDEQPAGTISQDQTLHNSSSSGCQLNQQPKIGLLLFGCLFFQVWIRNKTKKI